MRILFAGKQHFDPGGIPASVDDLARHLVAMGVAVGVVAHRSFDGDPAELRFALTEEQSDPYMAWSVDLATPGAALGMAVRRFEPDVLVISAGGWWWSDWTAALMAAAPSDLPTAVHVRDCGAIALLADGTVQPDLVLANAHAHADAMATEGIASVVNPSVVEMDRFRTATTGEAVVLINPHPTKGLATALALAAARPEVPFQFRESWLQSRTRRAELAEQSRDLPNVTLVPHTDDPAARYRDARVLLVPYTDGNRPRVVPEAQVSGIPILALGAPGLIECVGPGGLLVGEDASVDEWADALDRLWSDADEHRRLSEAARVHAARDEIAPASIATRFLNEMEAMLERGVSRPRSSPADDETVPMATVVVPVLNVGSTIDAQLDALANQTHAGPWEVVVADNGCTDDTIARVESRRPDLPGLRVVDAADRRGVAHARNIGLAEARGELLLICDGDDIIAPDWVAQMVGALEDHPLVIGAQDITSLNDPAQYEWLGESNRTAPRVAYDHLPAASGGNIGMWRDVFDTLGGFDTDLLRAEDADFSWRAQAIGIGVHLEPMALLHRRIRSTPGAEFRSAVRGGIAEVGLYRRHRDAGMPRSSWSEARHQWRRLVKQLPDAVRDRGDRYRWAHHVGKRVGRVMGSIRRRTRYL